MACQFHEAIERELDMLKGNAKDNREQIRLTQKWGVAIVLSFLASIIVQMWILVDMPRRLNSCQSAQIVNSAQAEGRK